jgi:hypothetical protein
MDFFPPLSVEQSAEGFLVMENIITSIGEGYVELPLEYIKTLFA